MPQKIFTSKELTEGDLLTQLKSKNPEALEYLYTHYSRALYGIILRIIKREDLAAELLQDTFIKIWQKIASYDATKGKLYTWMINIARHLAIDKLRSKEISQDAKTDGTINLVHMHVSHPKEDDIGVEDLLDQLDRDHKLVLNAIYFGGYTHAEVADAYDIPLGTVKTRVRNALGMLRKYLGPQ